MTTTTETGTVPDVFVTSYAVRDGDRTARVTLRDTGDPTSGTAWLVSVEGRYGVAVNDASRVGDDRFIGGGLNTHGEIPVPTPEDMQGQLGLALAYAADLLGFYREHDARLEAAMAVTAGHLARIRAKAGCVDR